MGNLVRVFAVLVGAMMLAASAMPPSSDPAYGGASSASSGGCKKGCRCGNSCIDCSKTCRGGSTYRKRKR